MAAGYRLDDEWVPKMLDIPSVEHIVFAAFARACGMGPIAAGFIDHKWGHSAHLRAWVGGEGGPQKAELV
jgi:hypothetical protein